MANRHVYSVAISNEGRAQHRWAQEVPAKQDAKFLAARGEPTGGIELYFTAEPNAPAARYVVYLVADQGRVPDTGGPTFLGVVAPSGSDPLLVWVVPANQWTLRDAASST